MYAGNDLKSLKAYILMCIHSGFKTGFKIGFWHVIYSEKDIWPNDLV